MAVTVTRRRPMPAAAPSLYDPAYEHEACGVGFVADTTGAVSRRPLEGALRALASLAHRGAVGADARTSDGAGIMMSVPARFFAAAASTDYADGLAVGVCFLSPDEVAARRERAIVETAVAAEGLRVATWRVVPVEEALLGDQARATLPRIEQALVPSPAELARDSDEFERRLLLARRAAERQATGAALDLTIPSFSSRTLVYKGLVNGPDLATVFPDLADARFETSFALFHQRYSTNTLPSWPLAQPFRLLAHNGEINTVQGNRRWMAAREPGLRSSLWGERLARLAPVVQPGGSDSASLDNVLELLVRSGRDPLEAFALLVGEAWERRDDLPTAYRAFYAYYAPLLEPWDGPGAFAFSDGQLVGAGLDRNGLRPARYRLTADNVLVVASEAGVLEPAGDEPAPVVEAGRLGPGELIAVDLTRGTLLRHTAILEELVNRHPYQAWLAERTASLPPATAPAPLPTAAATLVRAQRRYGYTAEDLRLGLAPMATEGHEAIWSMGDDAPPAVLSRKPQPLANYFRQRFAQVTNPPIDPLRERLVMALSTDLGPRHGALERALPPARLVHLESPVLSSELAASIAGLPQTITLPACVVADGRGETLTTALEALGKAALRALDAGATILIISDRESEQFADGALAPIPALLAIAAVHQCLCRAGRRLDCELVADSGDAWSVQHVALLLAYGAAAVHPYLALASARAAAVDDAGGAAERYIAALEEGLLKVLSKMGISTLRSYRGAGLFEAFGLGPALVAAYFPGTPSPLGGIGVTELARELADRHAAALAVAVPAPKGALPDHGFVRFRRDGERHAYEPRVVRALHQLTAGAGHASAAETFQDLTSVAEPQHVRDLLELRPVAPPVAIENVEAVESIRRRFIATAMSLGALSPEAYTTLAAGMNRCGGRSNSGEGGEDPAWYEPQSDGETRHSKIKQVASARFGVTANYLVHAEELEIKMAQGSKPGEGGQLPGHKVTEFIARLRHAVPGTPLISPPPHHDIYSIEDLAQLIHDLRAVNPTARVGVKLVATSGVGTIAAGVAKAGAGYVLISGHNGGTGASPLSSIKHAGLPWEIGLAEAQQTLMRNGLRDRVLLRTDGGLRTARDIIVAAALGADEFGFGTAALVALGCDMARQCHLNSCPVGIATQRPELRAKFQGKPEQVVAYFTWLAGQVRVLLASLGLSTLNDAVGRVELLHASSAATAAFPGLELARLLARPAPGEATCSSASDLAPLARAPLAARLLRDAEPALAGRSPFTGRYRVQNHDRSVGGELAGEIARRRAARTPAAPIQIDFRGSAGQSFGAFCVAGLTLRLIGEANDYVAKGMSGGLVSIADWAPAAASSDARVGAASLLTDGSWWRGARAKVLVGNTVLYGATGGALYVAGAAGERFAVRNSGATAVVEGIGDHGCEYMTGGVVVVLGPTGRNFAAGMSAGRAYVLDPAGTFTERCNMEHVRLGRLGAASTEAAEVRGVVERHLAATGSSRAADVLAVWDQIATSFWVVRPIAPAVAVETPPRRAIERAPRRDTIAFPVGGPDRVEIRADGSSDD